MEPDGFGDTAMVTEVIVYMWKGEPRISLYGDTMCTRQKGKSDIAHGGTGNLTCYLRV